MRVKIITEYKIKNKFTKEGLNEYGKRLTKYCKLNLKVTKNVEKEVKDRSYVIKISNAGESITSEQLAKKISSLGIRGNSDITIIIDDGYDMEKVDFTLSISNMDIDRDLMLIILYEQIYRAYRIINNEPYHK